MRVINYDEFMREKKEKFFSLRAKLGRRRAARRRNRDPEERDALMRMDKRRFERWLSDGTLEMLSPRHYILRLKPEDFALEDAQKHDGWDAGKK
ncbi:MAG: hypothetical protein AB2L14_33315 [Candidatus Xenobiia bacterium LiM19]